MEILFALAEEERQADADHEWIKNEFESLLSELAKPVLATPYETIAQRALSLKRFLSEKTTGCFSRNPATKTYKAKLESLDDLLLLRHPSAWKTDLLARAVIAGSVLLWFQYDYRAVLVGTILSASVPKIMTVIMMKPLTWAMSQVFAMMQDETTA